VAELLPCDPKLRQKLFFQSLIYINPRFAMYMIFLPLPSIRFRRILFQRFQGRCGPGLFLYLLSLRANFGRGFCGTFFTFFLFFLVELVHFVSYFPVSVAKFPGIPQPGSKPPGVHLMISTLPSAKRRTRKPFPFLKNYRWEGVE